MKHPLRLCASLLLGISLAFLPACGSTSGKPKVAFVSNNPEEFWTIAEAGCRKAESELDVEVVFRRPAKGDAALQKEIIDALLIQNIKAIAVSVIDPKNQTPYLDEIAAKVPLITQDNDAPDSKRLCYIGTNNYTAGRAVGKLVKESMPEGGTVAIFVGSLDALNARQRRQGVLDELADAPAPPDINQFERAADSGMFGKYKLHGTFTDQPEGVQKAKQNATDVITQLGGTPNICMVGLWAYNPPAILSAVTDSGKAGQIKIVGFDEDKATLEGIANGHVYATVVQDPFGFGYDSVKLMAALAKGDRSGLPKDGIKYVPHKVITRDGGPDRVAVKEFRDELDAILKK